MSNRPLNLQFFAEPTDPPAPTPPVPNPPVISAAQIAQIAEETLRLTEAANEKKARGIAKSMAEQNGLTEDELLAYIAEKKAAKANALPEDAQRQINEARAEVQRMKLETALTKEAAAMGLIDTDAAMKLMPEGAVKVNDKGEVTGLREALEALKKDKPYLFGVIKQAMAQKVTGQSAGVLDPVEEAFYRKNPKLRP